MEIRNKVAVVTGAAHGIGRETARQLLEAGARVCICDFNREALERTAEELRAHGEVLVAMHADVSNLADMQRFAAAVHEHTTAVDILINNAGVGLAGSFQETTLEDWDWIIGINLKGVVQGLHVFLPPMLERGGQGHIVNLSSMAGYWVGPGLTAYLSTKFGVFGLSEALREDLHGTPIRVSTICPGVIHTNIIATSRIRNSDVPEEMRAKVDEAYRKRNYGPERVAAAILKAIRKGRYIVPVSPEAWAMYYLTRFSPRLARFVARRVVKAMMH